MCFFVLACCAKPVCGVWSICINSQSRVVFSPQNDTPKGFISTFSQNNFDYMESVRPRM